jgi:hypothetical protein
MKLLHHRRIPREPTRIQPLHLLHQVLYLLQRRRIVPRQPPQLIQLRQPLPICLLPTRTVAVLRPIDLLTFAVKPVVPRIDVVIDDPIPTPRPAVRNIPALPRPT